MKRKRQAWHKNERIIYTIRELDLRDPNQRVMAQVGILLVQMVNLGLAARKK